MKVEWCQSHVSFKHLNFTTIVGKPEMKEIFYDQNSVTLTGLKHFFTDLEVLKVERMQLIDAVLNLCTYHHPENIQLPAGYCCYWLYATFSGHVYCLK